MAILKGFPPSNTISPGPRIACEKCKTVPCYCEGGMTIDGVQYPPDHGTRAYVISEASVSPPVVNAEEPFTEEVEKVLSELKKQLITGS